jgi:hypothetical protein
MMEKPITNTLFNTLPTAWVSGATLSKVLLASCNIRQHTRFFMSTFVEIQKAPSKWKAVGKFNLNMQHENS